MSGTLSSALRRVGVRVFCRSCVGTHGWESKLPSGNSPSLQLGLNDVDPVWHSSPSCWEESEFPSSLWWVKPRVKPRRHGGKPVDNCRVPSPWAKSKPCRDGSDGTQTWLGLEPIFSGLTQWPVGSKQSWLSMMLCCSSRGLRRWTALPSSGSGAHGPLLCRSVSSEASWAQEPTLTRLGELERARVS